ncbi:MAG: hypothetical protein QOH59_204 [Gemmatimonadales bacterium]|jgi:DNA-binding NarL/FixJ family response regulator|nr:hypothetical protein [Gemmatimonadales bacterium]
MQVLIADDHRLIRAGMRALLSNIPGIHGVLEAGSGSEALDIVARHRPEVALMDIAMPGMSGLEALSHIRQSRSDTRVIILSMHAGQEYVGRALHGGASGYLVKTAGVAELQQALMVVARGGTYVSPSLKSLAHKRDTERAPFERLTMRHREVLVLICQGRKTWEIADTLGIHAKTAECHRAELMNRLDIHSIAGLVRYAIRIGLVVPDQVEASSLAGAGAGGY